MIVLLVTVYAVGSEIKFRTGDDWLRTAGMNVFSAVAGKLLPYTVIFVLISVLANYVLFGVMRIPFSCGFWPLNLTSALFVVATQCLAVFLFSLFPAIGIVISVVSMVGSLGATLSGVTFPAPFMYEPVCSLRSCFRSAISSRSVRTCSTATTGSPIRGAERSRTAAVRAAGAAGAASLEKSRFKPSL